MAETDSRLDGVFKELIEEFLVRLRRGERPLIAEYVNRHPELAERIHEMFPTLGLVERFKHDLSEVADDPGSDLSVTHTASPLERLGDFLILREVGRGGMGIVYEAEQETLGRHVALKVMTRHGARMTPTWSVSVARPGLQPSCTIRISCRSSKSARKAISASTPCSLFRARAWTL